MGLKRVIAFGAAYPEVRSRREIDWSGLTEMGCALARAGFVLRVRGLGWACFRRLSETTSTF